MRMGKKGTWGDSLWWIPIYGIAALVMGANALILYLPYTYTNLKLDREMKSNPRLSIERRFVKQMCASGHQRFYESTRATLRKNNPNDEMFYKAMDVFLRKNNITPS